MHVNIWTANPFLWGYANSFGKKFRWGYGNREIQMRRYTNRLKHFVRVYEKLSLLISCFFYRKNIFLWFLFMWIQASNKIFNGMIVCSWPAKVSGRKQFQKSVTSKNEMLGYHHLPFTSSTSWAANRLNLTKRAVGHPILRARAGQKVMPGQILPMSVSCPPWQSLSKRHLSSAICW